MTASPCSSNSGCSTPAEHCEGRATSRSRWRPVRWCGPGVDSTRAWSGDKAFVVAIGGTVDLVEVGVGATEVEQDDVGFAGDVGAEEPRVHVLALAQDGGIED